MRWGFVLTLVLLLFVLFLTACTTVINPPSLPPEDLFDKTPREGCNNNGIIDKTEEQCDDGNWIINDKCDRCIKTFCGDEQYNDNPNNFYNFTEQCDTRDYIKGIKQCSNTTGINATCGFDCRCYTEETTIPPLCGDEILDGFATPFGWIGEECDAPNQAAANAQCIASGLGTKCNLNTCTCNPCNNNGIVEAGEQCDDGNNNPNDKCNLCKPTVCGDGILNNNPSNSAGLKEKCGEPGAVCPAGQYCKGCECIKDSVPRNDTVRNDTAINYTRVITPRCGDGYISSPNRPGGGSEDCDIGGGRIGSHVYPPAQDTCEEGKSCVECKCVADAVPRCGENEFMTRTTCDIGCDDNEECVLNEQTNCYFCREITDVCGLARLGDKDVFNSDEVCDEHCIGTCSEVDDSNGRCFVCNEEDIITETCPQGTYEDNCPSGCDSCNHISTLSDDTRCMQCVTYTCPQGQYKTQSLCQSSCDGNCVVGASQGGFNCYRCQVDCESYCSSREQQVGTGPDVRVIEDYLNENGVCKKNARTSIQRHTGQGCSCYSYNIEISGDVVCTGTPCGDVACNTQAECGDNPHYTVRCSWIGWRWISGYDYIPEVGSS